MVLLSILHDCPFAVGREKPLHILVAEKYGVKEFDKIQELSYTFNVIIGDKTIVRKWKWEPKNKKVTYFEDKKGKSEYAYHRDKLESGDKNKNLKVDKWFINDQYWLLFPFHLVWDDHVEITEREKNKSPIQKEYCRVLEIIYVDGKGYTPDDIYVTCPHKLCQLLC
jgi:hypothetical protein